MTDITSHPSDGQGAGTGAPEAAGADGRQTRHGSRGHGRHAHSGPAQGEARESHRHDNSGHGGGHPSGHENMVADLRRRFWASLILTLPILALSPMIQGVLGLATRLRFGGDLYVLFALSSVVFFYGGKPFWSGAIHELRDRQPGMMLLIAVAITTAYAYSGAVVLGTPGKIFFWELATLIDVMLLGHWVEMRSVMGASRALEELVRLLPSDAHLLQDDGSSRDVPLEDLEPGQRVLVRPGEKVPVDGTILAGETSVSEAMLTGESTPVHKTAGADVIGGSINGEGSITVEVSKVGADSFLSQVIDLVREAQESKSKTQDLANRAAVWLTYVALGGGATTLVAWAVLAGQEFSFALERAVTVMVIACPHALGLAVPLVVAVSTSLAAHRGLLIRDRAAFERARNLDAIIFDKTGTLTEGRFGVADVLSFDEGFPEGRILRLAAAVESHSEHPIARGIVRDADDIPQVAGFRSLPGKGAEGTVDEQRIQVVSPGFVEESGLVVDDPRAAALSDRGNTVVYVVVDGALVGALALADVVRPESREAIVRLREAGIRAMMLTGDHSDVAASVSEQVGLDEFIAEVLPGEKAARIREVQERGLMVAMTGDGVNDAPALAQADVGIAVGAGTDVAVETADVVLVRSNPLDTVAVVELSAATYRKMVQNLWWAAGYNILAIPLAAGVLAWAGIILGPAVGAMLMSASTVIVAINARMLRFGESV